MTNEEKTAIYYYLNIHELTNSLQHKSYYKIQTLNFTHCRIAGLYSKNYLTDLTTKSKVKISLKKECKDGFLICYGKWNDKELLVNFYRYVNERDIFVFYKEIELIKKHLKKLKSANLDLKNTRNENRRQNDIDLPFCFSDEKEKIKVQVPIMSQIQVAVTSREFNILSDFEDFEDIIPSPSKPISTQPNTEAIPTPSKLTSRVPKGFTLSQSTEVLSGNFLTSDIHSEELFVFDESAAKKDGDLFDDYG